jgi:hypothetical protein
MEGICITSLTRFMYTAMGEKQASHTDGCAGYIISNILSSKHIKMDLARQ